VADMVMLFAIRISKAFGEQQSIELQAIQGSRDKLIRSMKETIDFANKRHLLRKM
jgi:hypothetical protein